MNYYWPCASGKPGVQPLLSSAKSPQRGHIMQIKIERGACSTLLSLVTFPLLPHTHTHTQRTSQRCESGAKARLVSSSFFARSPQSTSFFFPFLSSVRSAFLRFFILFTRSYLFLRARDNNTCYVKFYTRFPSHKAPHTPFQYINAGSTL